MGPVAASDHQGWREWKVLKAEARRGGLLVQVCPPGAQHLDIGLRAAHPIGFVHREKDPRPGLVALVEFLGEAGKAPEQGLGHPAVTTAFQVIEDLKGQRPFPGLLFRAVQHASQKGQGVGHQPVV